MWTQLLLGAGGVVVFALLFATFHVLANRARVLSGECRLDSIRCLGCLATGRCGAEGGAAAIRRRRMPRG